MYAFAKLQDTGPGIGGGKEAALGALAAATAASVQREAAEWTPQGLSNVCWAAGTLGLRSEGLSRALLGALQHRAQELNCQELSNTVRILSEEGRAGYTPLPHWAMLPFQR